MRTWTVRAASAVYGLSLAIAIAPRLMIPARGGDPLSALKLAGYSSRGPILQMALAVVMTALAAIAGERIARLLAPYRWAVIAYCAALACAPLTLMSFGNERHVLLIGIVAAAIVALRKRDPHFTIRDVVLIPAFLACQIAFLDAGFGRTPVATALRAAIAVFALRMIVRAAEPFLLAPLALFAEIGLLQPRVGAGIALIILFGTPFLKIRPSPKVIYPLIVFAYPLAVLRVPPPTTANFFEDGHAIPVATEMLRGERPYTDIVPTHGFISDGLIDFLALKLGKQTMRTILATRIVVGMLSGVAIYCLAFAATGSAEMGLLAAFLAFALTPGATIWVRPWGALFAVAATVAATRLRSRRWLVIAGALVVLACLVSIDLGIYSAVVACFAAFRLRALRALAIGIAAAAIPTLIVFAIFGFAIDFLRATFVEILGGHGVYFARVPAIPECLRSPALVHHLAECFEPIVWVIALIASCAALALSPWRARRSDGPWLIGVWMVVAAASFVERGNSYFVPALASFIVAALWAMRRRSRTLTGVLAVIVILIAQPIRHVITVIPELRESPMPALFDDTVNKSINAARRFNATLAPSDTFVDFANSALLYPLLGRDCPLRHVEVGNYQSPDAQREVIARIERNRRIRAVLMAFPGSNQSVDGVPNIDRAPLVAEYLRRNFAPAFDEDGVVFWKRVR